MDATSRAIIELAVKMRTAQKDYFAARTTDKLIASKALEKEFDIKAKNALLENQSATG